MTNRCAERHPRTGEQCERRPHLDDQHQGTTADGKQTTWRSS